MMSFKYKYLSVLLRTQTRNAGKFVDIRFGIETEVRQQRVPIGYTYKTHYVHWFPRFTKKSNSLALGTLDSIVEGYGFMYKCL